MHEFSIVQSLLDSVESYAVSEGAHHVTRVIVRAGALAGIEPHLLKVAFDTFREGTICKDAALEIIIDPLRLHCKSCDRDVSTGTLRLICPECGSTEVNVLEGDEIILERIEMETADAEVEDKS
ncbi:MAG: hydrogenase maturation nickel metallochaperone HypA [Nitrospirae bacterium]|nr:MAG: hydrogenase maturation nickel metallochaperone HypA [Nitrospirota bacterium]